MSFGKTAITSLSLKHKSSLPGHCLDHHFFKDSAGLSLSEERKNLYHCYYEFTMPLNLRRVNIR